MTHLLSEKGFQKTFPNHIINHVTLFWRILPEGFLVGLKIAASEGFFQTILLKESWEVLLCQTLGYHNSPSLSILFFLQTKWRVLCNEMKRYVSEDSFRRLLQSSRRLAFRMSAINRTNRLGNFTHVYAFLTDFFLPLESFFWRKSLPKEIISEV